MIARPDFIRRKYVMVGAALALGVLVLVLLSDDAGSSRWRDRNGFNAAASFAPSSGGSLTREAQNPWKTYAGTPTRDVAWPQASTERGRQP